MKYREFWITPPSEMDEYDVSGYVHNSAPRECELKMAEQHKYEIIHVIEKSAYDKCHDDFIEHDRDMKKLDQERVRCIDILEKKLNILRRYHGGDNTVTREQVMEALSGTGKD